MSQSTRPRLWITYAWKDNQEGDFDYLVQELARFGVVATYDRVALIPGLRLWEQIGDKITSGDLDGWAYLITPKSLESQPCKEELFYAVGRALDTKGDAFPLIGLVTTGVPMSEVPPSLRIRLCVNLADSNWREQVRAALERRPPVLATTLSTPYIWQVWKNVDDLASRIAIEVRPRFGQIPFWRFVVPASTTVYKYARSAAGAGLHGPMMKTYVPDKGDAEVNGQPCKWFGTGDALSPDMSAYVVIDGPVPEFVGFGPARTVFGPPDETAIDIQPIAGRFD